MSRKFSQLLNLYITREIKFLISTLNFVLSKVRIFNHLGYFGGFREKADRVPLFLVLFCRPRVIYPLNRKKWVLIVFPIEYFQGEVSSFPAKTCGLFNAIRKFLGVMIGKWGDCWAKMAVNANTREKKLCSLVRHRGYHVLASVLEYEKIVFAIHSVTVRTSWMGRYQMDVWKPLKNVFNIFFGHTTELSNES